MAGAKWQMHDEGRARAQRALNCETAAVPVEHMLDQSQPQPGAALCAAVDNIDAIKAFCQPWQMFGSDAWTVVAYRHACFRRAAACLPLRQCDVDALPGGTIFERVFDQIVESANQFVAITAHHQRI